MEYLQYFDNILRIDVNLEVLNLVISGIPSIQLWKNSKKVVLVVLNLVISGIPSILMMNTLGGI